MAQHRRRVFLVGIRSDINVEFNFPPPTHGPGRRPFVSQREAIGHLPRWPTGGFQSRVVPLVLPISEESASPGASQARALSDIGAMFPSTPPVLLYAASTQIHWEFTREAPARRLSYQECALLQGFPQSFKWRRGRIRERFQMIGNAVLRLVLSGVSAAEVDMNMPDAPHRFPRLQRNLDTRRSMWRSYGLDPGESTIRRRCEAQGSRPDTTVP